MKTPLLNLSKKQNEIFSVSVELFFEKGYAETSVRDIADKLGILAASLYSHISSKEQILEWIAQYYVELLEAELRSFNSEERDFENRFQFMIRRNITLVYENLKIAEIFRRYYDHISADTKSRYTKFTEAYTLNLSETLRHFGIDKKLQLDSVLAAKFFMYNMNYAYKWVPEDYVAEQIITIFEKNFLFNLQGIKLSP